MQPPSISDDDDKRIAKKGIRTGMPWAINRPVDATYTLVAVGQLEEVGFVVSAMRGADQGSFVKIQIRKNWRCARSIRLSMVIVAIRLVAGQHSIGDVICLRSRGAKTIR